MKIAIPIFGNRISPRFDFSPEIWIVDVVEGAVLNCEKLLMENVDLSQRIDHVVGSGARAVICGGIDGYSIGQLESKGIEVFSDVIGEPEVAVDLFIKKKLRQGLCCERRRNRGSCPWRGRTRTRRGMHGKREV